MSPFLQMLVISPEKRQRDEETSWSSANKRSRVSVAVDIKVLTVDEIIRESGISRAGIVRSCG